MRPFLTATAFAVLAAIAPMQPRLLTAAESQSLIDSFRAADSEAELDPIVVSGFYEGTRGSASVSQFEEASAMLRETRARFSDGQPKLAAFYRAMANVVTSTMATPILKSWREAYPNSPTPVVLTAMAELGNAVSGAGMAFISTADAQSYRTDTAKLDAVMAVLNDTKSFSAEDPNWYHTALSALLVTAGSENTFKDLAHEAVRKFPGYLELYDPVTDYFLPKWHGSSAALDAWIHEILRDIPEDMRSVAYARMYWRAFRVNYGMQLFDRSQVNWTDLKSGAADLITRDRSSMLWSNFAMLACLAGDHEETKRILSGHDQPPDLDGIYSQNERDVCVDWAQKSGLQIKYEELTSTLWSWLRVLVHHWTGIWLPEQI